MVGRFRTIERGADGRPWLSLARDGNRVHLRFRGVGRFVLSADGGRVGGFPERGVDAELFRRILLDHVLPRASHRAGRPMLHASAVAGPRGAVVFLGGSGSGKSTLAARRVLEGWPLLADDGVRLSVRGGVVRAHPTHPFLRLREPFVRRLPADVRKAAVPAAGKWTLDCRRAPLRFAARPVPVHRIYLLDSEGGDTGAVGPREGLLTLLDGTFRADPWDCAAFARDVRLYAGVLGVVTPYRRHGLR